MGLAAVQLDQRAPERAKATYEALLKRQPGHAAARQGLAQAANELDRPDEALPILDDLIKTHPDVAALYVERSHSWDKKGDKVRALIDLDKAISLDPQSVDGLYARGVAHAQGKRLALAVKDFDALLKVDDSDPAALWWRSRVKAELGDAAGAKADRDAALKLAPDLVVEMDKLLTT